MGRVIRVGGCGAIAGATNAWLCYARLPVPVRDDPSFAWHLIPAGALHGAFLAAFAFAVAQQCARGSAWPKVALTLPVGWFGGFASWIPLDRSVMGSSRSLWRSLTWPFGDGWVALTIGPLQYFGLVALVYYVGLLLARRSRRRIFAVQLVAACAAGVLGSLWWWIECGPWFFSVLHGTLWGCCVAVGAWASEAFERRITTG